MKKSVSLFLDQMSNALNPLPDDEDEAIMIVGSDTVTLSRLQVINVISFYFNSMVFLNNILFWQFIGANLYSGQ